MGWLISALLTDMLRFFFYTPRFSVGLVLVCFFVFGLGLGFFRGLKWSGLVQFGVDWYELA